MKNIIMLWGCMLALLIAVALSAQEPVQEPAAEQSSAQEATTEQEPVPLNAADSLPRTPTTDAYNQQSEECPPLTTAEFWLVGEDRAVELLDLKQQCRMAVSTEEIAYLTKWQVWVGIGGLALLMATLYFTHQAAQSTKKTLKIARKTLAQTEFSTKTELRAYLCPVRSFAVKSKRGACDDLIIEWRNAGNTPAYIKKIWYSSTLVSGELGPSFSPITGVNKSDAVAKDGTFKLPIALDPGVRKHEFQSHNPYTLWVAACIVYQDVFKRTFAYTQIGRVERPEPRYLFMNDKPAERLYNFDEEGEIENELWLIPNYGERLISEDPNCDTQTPTIVDFRLYPPKPPLQI